MILRAPILILVAFTAAAAGQCTWSPLGSGPTGPVHALAVFDDGSGPALHVAGDFLFAGGVLVRRVARWDGTAWSALGIGVDGPVRGLCVFDQGSGATLVAGGSFTNAGGTSAARIASWDGSGWSALGSGAGDVVKAFATFDDGGGPQLHAGGAFAFMGGVLVRRIARWDGSGWSALGSPPGVDGNVLALATFDDGGEALYAGGGFTLAGVHAAARIARWDGSAWAPVGGGLNGSVRALAVHDDGTGPALYAGGGFTQAGPVPAAHVARWDGTAWSSVGGGTDGAVNALCVFDDGSGPALYAAGSFMTAGGQPAGRIARWDGSSWQPLGAGLGGGPAAAGRALAALEGGPAPRLFAGGTFTAVGGSAAAAVAAWTGTGPLRVLLEQPQGPGTGVVVTDEGLVAGRTYRNVFSVDPCPGAPGTGPFLGLCAQDPSLLVFQSLLPPGSGFFHFQAAGCRVAWPPAAVPPMTVEVLLVETTGGVLAAVSDVTRLAVQ